MRGREKDEKNGEREDEGRGGRGSFWVNSKESKCDVWEERRKRRDGKEKERKT